MARRALARGVAMLCAMAAIAATPSSALAFGSHGGTETSNGTAPADGSLITHTDAIPAGATQGSLGVQPLPGTDASAFDDVTAVLVQDFPWLGKLSKRGQATLAIAYRNPTSKPVGIRTTFAVN
jgi:hypothetical protein